MARRSLTFAPIVLPAEGERRYWNTVVAGLMWINLTTWHFEGREQKSLFSQKKMYICNKGLAAFLLVSLCEVVETKYSARTAKFRWKVKIDILYC